MKVEFSHDDEDVNVLWVPETDEDKIILNRIHTYNDVCTDMFEASGILTVRFHDQS